MEWTTSIHALDDEAAQDRWQALWETSPQRSRFSSLPYARAAVQAFSMECEMHLVAGPNGDAAGALVFWRKRGLYNEVILPPFTQYTPVVLRHPLKEVEVHERRSAFEALLAVLERRFDILRFFCPAITDIRPAQWRRWNARPFYTYLLSLNKGDDLLQRWSRSTLRSFHKQAAAYRFEENPGAAANIISLCSESYQRHGRPFPSDHARLHDLIDGLLTMDQVRLFTVTPREDSAPEAGLALLHDGQTAHYWIAGSLPGPAMIVLLGNLLPLLQADGFKTFDFVGANTPSIAEFKRRFGPKLTPYFLLEKITRPELRLLYRLKGA